MIQTLERPPAGIPPAKPRPKKLTLWRRALRRTVKPLIMAFIAGGMALGLVAVPVAKAEADVISAATIAEINGAMKLPLTQVVLGAIRAHPIGFAITTVAALGLLAYATKDQWMPYTPGDFGKGGVDTVTPSGVRSFQDVTYTRNANVFAITMTWPASGIASDRHMYYGAIAKCKNTSTGNVGYVSKGGYLTIPPSAPAGSQQLSLTVCNPAYQTTVGWLVGGGQGSTIGSYLPNHDGVSGVTVPVAMNSITPSGNFGYATKNVYGGGEMGSLTFDPKDAGTSYVTSAECIDAAGTKSVVEYTSKGTDGMLRMPPCGVLKPGTHGTGKMWIDGYAPGSTVPQRLWETDPMTDADHPLCSASGTGSGCTLSVWIDGKECVSGNVECENWTDIRRDTASRVSCHYGPYIVGSEQCNILERAYTVGGAPATKENIDGDPATRSWTDISGNPWQPQPQPNPAPGTGTSTGTIPSTGVTPGGSPNAEAKDRDCLAEEWSWDPSSWVLAPIQCGMEWAFVPPKTSIEAAVQTLTPKLEARGIAPFVAPVMAGIDGLGGNGCQGPAINLSAIKIPETLYPFSACEQPMSQIATGVYSFFALSIVLQGGMSCIRGVAAAFGFNWGLGSSKVTDGS